MTPAAARGSVRSRSRASAAASERGLTLIELLIAMTISLIVLGAVSYVYLGTHGAYRTNESAARVQETGRFAMDSVTRDLRSTGFLGCGSSLTATGSVPLAITNVSNVNTVAVVNYAGGVGAVSGFSQATWNSAAFVTAYTPSHAYVPNTDVLIIRVATSAPAPVESIAPGGSAVTADGAVCAALNTTGNSYLLVSSCTRAALINVTGSTCGAAGTAQTGTVTVNYSAGAVAINPPGVPALTIDGYPTAQQFDEVTYFVGTNETGGTSLYRHSAATGNEDEIVDNVEDMALQFGLGDPVAGGDATSSKVLYGANLMGAADWPAVVSVQVVVQAVGSNAQAGGGATNQAQVLTLLPLRPVPPSVTADTRLRDVFSTTVALRDRMS